MSVKDLIEALGVPHTEVDLVLANGESVDFSYRVKDGDRISVYPPFEAMDISPLVRLRPQPLRDLRFVADAHLGRLAAYLRMAGFDTIYRRDSKDKELALISAKERRILLTRDRGLLKRNIVTRGYCVHCNELLQPTPKELINERLQPETRQYFEEFSTCPACHRIYWKGSHYRRMQRFIEGVIMPKGDVSRA